MSDFLWTRYPYEGWQGTVAALLEATEGRGRVEVVVRVDPHRPCPHRIQRLASSHGLLDILAQTLLLPTTQTVLNQF